jgi:hypothetical protein
MDDFDTRGAALDYWFWKFHCDDLDLLVDFIVRRRIGTAEVRVSLWAPGRQGVERLVSDDWSSVGSRVAIGGQTLDTGGSRGAVHDLSWDLRWDRGPAIVNPRPALMGPIHPFDIEIVIRPLARFSGSVTLADRTYRLDDVPGAVCHYWGRRLADRWCWISVTEFEQNPSQRLELVIANSKLWGRGRLPLPIGYLWVTDGSREELVVSALTGLLRERRDGDSTVIDSVRLDGTRHRVRAAAPAGAFNDLGEGIRQTLLADLEFDGLRAVPGRVGLEFRG